MFSLKPQLPGIPQVLNVKAKDCQAEVPDIHRKRFEVCPMCHDPRCELGSWVYA